MRRTLYWHLPVVAATLAAAVFAWGMYTAVAGGGGAEVPAGSAATRARISPVATLEQVLILGDSLARGAGDESGRGIGGHLEDLLGDVEIVNLGIDGARTADLTSTVARESIRTLASRSQAIIVSIGGNDLFRESREGEFEQSGQTEATLAEVRGRVAEIVATLRSASPGARIFIIGLYDPFQEPERTTARAVAQWNAGLLEEFADDPRISVVGTADLFVDHDRLSRDRFHPGEAAYGIIARRIAEALEQ